MGFVFLEPLSGSFSHGSDPPRLLRFAERGIPFHVEVTPPDGGLTMRSFIRCEELRGISESFRLKRRLGQVSDRTMEAVEDRITIVLDLRP